MEYDYQKIFTLEGHSGSLDDLGETLRALEKEYNNTGRFSKKVILKIEEDFWDIVAPKIHDFKKYIEKVSADQATITSVNSYDYDRDRAMSVVNLVWKGNF
jgi:hypothetical protein